jgi:hypothetical protein
MGISAADGISIQRWAKGGKSIVEICKLLNDRYGYTDIQAYMWDNDCLPLMGAKRRVSNHLKKFVTAGRADERKQLATEINQSVKYIYYGYRETLKALKESRKRASRLQKQLDAK